jgi:hypothetical protein
VRDPATNGAGIDMQIEFCPTSIDDEQENGDFRMAVSDCLVYMKSQFGNYGIPLDGQLLEWILHLNEQHSTNASNRIPERFDERARFMVADLIEACQHIETVCRKCNRVFATTDLQKKEWDSVSDSAGIRVGSSGYRITCPIGHALISVTTKLY